MVTARAAGQSSGSSPKLPQEADQRLKVLARQSLHCRGRDTELVHQSLPGGGPLRRERHQLHSAVSVTLVPLGKPGAFQAVDDECGVRRIAAPVACE